ncbi:hypothetical protein B0H13DRAFT_2289511 [Mycena leptocephala]|nr:hypothetical protein B0H13DRAFT_2289511 [Mycena leptocephala]
MGTTTRYADIAVDVAVTSVASAASAASVASIWAAMTSHNRSAVQTVDERSSPTGNPPPQPAQQSPIAIIVFPSLNRQHKFRTALNNVAQQSRQIVEYYDSMSGSLTNPIWTSIIRVNHVEYGGGTGSDRDSARECAAKHALTNLGLTKGTG